MLLYNGKNASGEDADLAVPENTYCGGQVLFDKDDPVKVIARAETYYIKPICRTRSQDNTRPGQPSRKDWSTSGTNGIYITG